MCPGPQARAGCGCEPWRVPEAGPLRAVRLQTSGAWTREPPGQCVRACVCTCVSGCGCGFGADVGDLTEPSARVDEEE